MPARLVLNRMRMYVNVRWDRWRPRLVFPERYEKRVKWVLRLIFLAGIATSVLAFDQWYYNLTLALALAGAEQLLERCVFTFSTMYVLPGLDFPFDETEWKAMVFAPLSLNSPGLIGVVFATEAYARRFFDLLVSWNGGQLEDASDNIHISFVTEDNGDFTVCIYPTPQRDAFDAFLADVRDSTRAERPGKEHIPLLVSRHFAKRVPLGPMPSFGAFFRNQAPGQPFVVLPYTWIGNQQAQAIDGVHPIVKYHFKYRKRSDLRDDELEKYIQV